MPANMRDLIFVYVVELTRDDDLYDGRSDGDLVRAAAEINEIPCVVRKVASQAMFWRALDEVLEANKKYRRVPILHISAHGDVAGIGLLNGARVNWSDMRDRLREINERLGGALIVCMSSCRGMGASTMAVVDGDLPYISLVGSYSEPTWAETAVGYATFYHQIARGKIIAEAVEAMKVASGHDGFDSMSGRATRVMFEVFHELLPTGATMEEMAREVNSRLAALQRAD